MPDEQDTVTGLPQEKRNELVEKAGAALAKLVDKLVTLRIVTVIGAVEAIEPAGGGAGGNGTATIPPMRPKLDQSKVMLSEIDLAQGDITTVIHPDLLAPEYETLRRLHTEREANGQKIVSDNIKAIQDFIRAVST